MSRLFTGRAFIQVITIRAMNSRGWTTIDGVYVFDFDQGNYDDGVSRVNIIDEVYVYDSLDMNQGNINGGVSRVNIIDEVYVFDSPYMDQGNNNNNNNVNNNAPQHSIENLEKFKIEGATDSSSMPLCSICLDVLSVGSEAIRVPCSHVYHQQCIMKWLNVRNTCPLCRGTI